MTTHEHGEHSSAGHEGAAHGHEEHGKEHGGKGHGAQGGHDAHGGHGGGHGGHKKHGEHEHAHHGPPPWLISFGDMMTLFLCFFIMLVCFAPKRDAGLMAAGLGSFVSSSINHGMDGVLGGQERLAAINSYRQRFGLEPLVTLEQEPREGAAQSTSQLEDLLANALKPHTEIPQLAIASFAADSDELSEQSKHFLDLIAETLRPGSGQVLLLEGHGGDAAARFGAEPAWLGLARASAVRAYLMEEHQFVSTRVEARTWANTQADDYQEASSVDARLISPIP